MTELELLQTDAGTQMFMVGQDYPEDWRLTADELDDLSKRAIEQLSTINGDTGIVEVTVRQLGLLLYGIWSGEPCQVGQDRHLNAANAKVALKELSERNPLHNDEDAYQLRLVEWALGESDTKPNPDDFGVYRISQ